jgi:pyruvate dehydrogenase E2 component (dihydrolipoamide acetyltransferase)
MAGEIQPIVMPKWGLAMEEGVVTPGTSPGRHITKGQEIADIETSKIANVFESPVAGTLRKLVARPARRCRSAPCWRSSPTRASATRA